MIHFKHIIAFLAFTIFSMSAFAVAPDGITKNIEQAIRSGSAGDLAHYFNSSIRLKIDDRQQVYSKRQAEAILNDFFSRNNPVSYTVSDIRDSGEQKTVMGVLKTDVYTYRFLYRISDYNNTQVISYIEIQTL